VLPESGEGNPTGRESRTPGGWKGGDSCSKERGKKENLTRRGSRFRGEKEGQHVDPAYGKACGAKKTLLKGGGTRYGRSPVKKP